MKCISIDLDGTLLNDEGFISRENIKALNELKRRGYEVIINTGRAFVDVETIPYLEDLKLPTICLNGMKIYSSKRKVLCEVSIDHSIYNEIFKKIKKTNLFFFVFTSESVYPVSYFDYLKMSRQEAEKVRKEFDCINSVKKNNLKLYKFLVKSNDEERGYLEELRKEISEMDFVSLTSSHSNNLEISSNELDKGRAILKYAKIMGITYDKIIAIGDGENDESQLKIADISIAMGNAPSSIKKNVDYITKRNTEDGFAYAVKHFLVM